MLAVTMSAGWLKIFAADPRVGFLSAADALKQRIAGGGTARQLADWEHLVTNNYINTAVTGTFLVLVLIVVAANARVWWELLSGRRPADLREEAYVPLAPAPATK